MILEEIFYIYHIGMEGKKQLCIHLQKLYSIIFP